MPAKLERALKSAARKKGLKGKRADRYVYGSMNNMGVMHGNKVVKKRPVVSAASMHKG